MRGDHYALAEQAKKHEASDSWRDAEVLYLRTAQMLATSQLADDVKARKMYDAAAKRCRRLHVLTIVS